jgi:hypothetical protein
MKSVGYNFPARAHGKVSTYFYGDMQLRAQQLLLWQMAVCFGEVVGKAITSCMGTTPLALVQCKLKGHYSDPVSLGCEASLAYLAPTITLDSTSLHQTRNSGVDPHIDDNDLEYTIIVWIQDDKVQGCFVFHGYGYVLVIKVRSCV